MHMHTHTIVQTRTNAEVEIVDDDIFTIWASDGVWEFISNDEAVQICWKHRNDL
jgi:serine/threonine protein phosphatase PrpC